MPYSETNKERGPLPGLLTVDYFTTSPGGILAPRTRVSNVSRKTRVRHQGDTTAHQLVSMHGL